MADSASPPPKDPAQGQILGRYELLEEIGIGGMGIVYLAETLTGPPSNAGDTEGEPPPPGTRVAVKVLHAHLVSTKDHGRRFRREGRLGASVVHENLVRTYEAGTGEFKGATTNYLGEWGTAPYMRLFAPASWTPAANETPLHLVEGTGPTLRNVRWKKGNQLGAQDRVMVLV